MAKSIKFTDDIYLDSKGVVDNKNTLDYVLERKAVSEYLGNNPDIDQLRYTSGVYGIYNCSKTPFDRIGTLEVLVYSGDWVVQRYTELTGNGLSFERRFTWGTTWSKWMYLGNGKKSYYITTTAGLLVKLYDAKLYKMLTVKIIGNGYSANPIDTIIQGYHYTPLGNFIYCKQHNNFGSLPACKFFIRDGFIHLWIPKVGAYCTYVVQIYETNSDYDESPFEATMPTNAPSETGVTCTIV